MRRARVELTDSMIRGLKPGQEARDAQVPGLSARRLPSGRVVFSLRYGSDERRHTLGEYGETERVTVRDPETGANVERFARMSLAVARREARAWRERIANRDTPHAERERREAAEAARRRAAAEREDRRQRGEPAPGTFAEIARKYLASRRPEAKAGAGRRRLPRARTVAEEQRKLEVEILPALAERPAGEITRPELLALLETIRDERGGVCANRSQTLLRAVFEFAADRALAGVKANPVPRKRLHHEQPRERRLLDDELAAVWQALGETVRARVRGPAGTVVESEEITHPRFALEVAAAWKLILLTAARPGEVMAMRWSSLRTERGGDAYWTIPAEVAKNGQEHDVFLSGEALAILEELRPLTGDSEFVLASPRRRQGGGREAGEERLRWLSSSSRRLRARVAAILGHEVAAFTPHDARRTAATLLVELGVAPHVVNAVLNHKPPRLDSTYMRTKYRTERRHALALLGQRVAAIAAGVEQAPNVLQFPGGTVSPA